MNLDTGVGAKIIFLAENGYDKPLEWAKKELEKGKEYTVESMDVGRSSSTVTLVENGKSYNTVMFKNAGPYTPRNWFGEQYGGIL